MSDRDEVGLQAEFWNQAGGRMWVERIERTHSFIAGLGDEAVRRVAPAPGEHVLDVGCGGGPNTVQIAHLVAPDGQVLGVDVSRIILDYARAQPDIPDNVTFRLADAGREDLGTDAFDLIFSRFGVMFFEDPKAAFTNLRRSLKAGGRLGFLCWQAVQKNPWLGAPLQALFEVLPAPEAPADPRAPGPFAFAEPDWIREILTAAGFEDIRIEALEAPIHMGTLAEATDYMMNFGPAVEALNAASAEERQAVQERIEAAFQPFVSERGVQAPAATWMVTAR